MEAVAEHAEPIRANEDAWPFPRIRPALPADIDALMDMCRVMFDENGIGPGMDEGVVLAEMTETILGKRPGFLGVIGDEGRIEGSLFLVTGCLWYNPSYFWLEDRWVFVLPEYRRSKQGEPSNAVQLIKCAEHIAGRLGLPLMLAILNNTRTEAKVRLYRRILGEPSGAFFLKGAKTGHH